MTQPYIKPALDKEALRAIAERFILTGPHADLPNGGSLLTATEVDVITGLVRNAMASVTL